VVHPRERTPRAGYRGEPKGSPPALDLRKRQVGQRSEPRREPRLVDRERRRTGERRVDRGRDAPDVLLPAAHPRHVAARVGERDERPKRAPGGNARRRRRVRGEHPHRPHQQRRRQRVIGERTPAAV
jgi:hypothetical protein